MALADSILQDEQYEIADVVIVGTGPVGLRLAEAVLERTPQWQVRLFGDEPWVPYDRVRLSQLLAGQANAPDLEIAPKSAQAMVFHHSTRITQIDRTQKEVIDDHGRRYGYRFLVLATGSRSHIPSITNIDCKGVFTFRDMSDVQALMARRIRSRHTVVLGGGLLGLEAARAMQRHHTKVTIIEHERHLLKRQLDDASAELVRDRLLSMGMQVSLGHAVSEVIGQEYVKGVRLRNGRFIHCDTLILATGVRANLELAREARIHVGRGILVNDNLRTSDDDIFAVGECVEHRGLLYGLVKPGLEQAEVAAKVITGQKAQYIGSTTQTNLKVIDLPIFSAGEAADSELLSARTQLIYTDTANGIYRKLILKRGVLTGAIAVGEWAELGRLQDRLLHRHRLWPWQQKRFIRDGHVWSDAQESNVIAWPSASVVCQCKGVTRGELGQAITQGCQRLDELARQTGASTVCGSCQPLVAQLLGQVITPSQKSPGRKILAVSSVMAFMLAVMWWLFDPLARYDSVLDWRFQISTLWRDSLWKQVSGFTLVGLGMIGLLQSARKRLSKQRQWGAYGWWRAGHALLGGLALLLLLFHTGLEWGERLNLWLLLNFILMAMLGSFAALGVLREQSTQGLNGRRTRYWFSKLHLWLTWPLPVLLGYHILSVYYF